MFSPLPFVISYSPEITRTGPQRKAVTLSRVAQWLRDPKGRWRQTAEKTQDSLSASCFIPLQFVWLVWDYREEG